MLRRAMAVFGLCVLACGVVASLAPAADAPKKGMVITKDKPPHVFIGEIDTTTEPGHVDINSATQGKVSLDSRNVERVTFFNTPAEEFNGRLSALERKDVAGRVDLANFAVANNMYPQAHEVLVGALAIEPGNRNATDLLAKVNAQIKASNPPATQAVAPPVQSDPAPSRPGLVRAKRTLTPDEINFIRQNEWTEADQDIKVLVTSDAKKGALDLGLIDRDAISKMSQADIGWKILRGGPPGLRKDVKVASDPGSLFAYRTKVHRLVIATCATGACHNTEKGGKFYLFTQPAQSDATVISDYVILQQFAMTIKNVEKQMIDRSHPEDSLLTQFALPPAIANFPHPKGPGYAPPTKPAFQIKAVEEWISSLPAVAPAYDIDLSVPPPKPEGAKPAGK